MRQTELASPTAGLLSVVGTNIRHAGCCRPVGCSFQAICNQSTSCSRSPFEFLAESSFASSLNLRRWLGLGWRLDWFGSRGRKLVSRLDSREFRKLLGCFWISLRSFLSPPRCCLFGSLDGTPLQACSRLAWSPFNLQSFWHSTLGNKFYPLYWYWKAVL